MGQGPLTDDEATRLAEAQEALAAIDENPQAECHRVFQNAAPNAAREIVRLAMFGSNERIKLSACLHITERTLGRVQDNPPTPSDDPFRDMMMEVSEIQKTATQLTNEQRDDIMGKAH